MDQSLVEATALAGSVENVNLSVWSLFLQATLIVKIVIVALILASIWTWAIIIEKVWRMRRLDRAATAFEDEFWSGGTLDGLY
ncbi:MAG: protein TolQ, partial [Rhodospirillaceae bacterium]|nr:protein TolQ [Rhodospirillaceae bacterium]